MLLNKTKMLLGTVAKIFLVTQSDVQNLRQVTLETNEHNYGGWRYVLREFNMAQVIVIE